MFFVFADVCLFILYSISVQDAPPYDSWLSRPWNAACPVDFKDFLVSHHSEEARGRLKTLGNIVVPFQAAAGISMLVQVAHIQS